MPLVTADIADVEIHQIYHIILDIDNIGLLSMIRFACLVGASDILANVGQSRILPSELIQKNLIALR